MLSTNLDKKLDLSQFLDRFKSFFAREKSIQLQGDISKHLQFINSLEDIEFQSPPTVEEIWKSIQHIRKFGVLSLNQIFEILKIVRYFYYLKTVKLNGLALNWIEKIDIPDYFKILDSYFDKDGNFRDEVDERLISIQIGIKEIKSEISQSLYSILHSQKVEEYLVDKQIHYINESEALLLKGGFTSVIKGNVIGRSSAGYFYVVPDKISTLLKKIRNYQQEQESIYLQYRKDISKRLKQLIPFIKFIDREFDRFDHYQARINFAKSEDLNFLLESFF